MKPTTEREAQEALIGMVVGVRALSATHYVLRYEDGRMVIVESPVARRGTQLAPAVSALLRAAAGIVERALGLLDLAEQRCPHGCGRRVFANHDHAKVAERLDATPEKLRVSAGRLENAELRGARAHVCVCQQPGA